MKKLFVICLLLVCSMANLSAQTVTKNTLPKNLKGVHMNFEVDFSQAMILGKTETEYSEYEKDWNKDKETIVRNFRVATNLAIGKSYKVGEYKDATYVIKVKVNTITDYCFDRYQTFKNENMGNINRKKTGKHLKIRNV